MTLQFLPDIFSRQRPIWQSVDKATELRLRDIVTTMTCLEIDKSVPQKVIGSEINSRNYKLKLADGRTVVLKANASKIPPTYQNIAIYLSKNGIPAPCPVPIDHKNYEFFLDGATWSLSEFIDGFYFSGHGGELKNLAKFCGKLDDVMKDFKYENEIKKWNDQFSFANIKLIEEVQKRRDEWPHLLGESSFLLERTWKDVMNRWRSLSDNPPDMNWKGIMHFDLHPHNVLCRNQSVTAILDIESFRYGPLGIALAFAGLKLCRQTVVHFGSPSKAGEIGSEFINTLAGTFTDIPIPNFEFAKLAQVEVFRRIFLILELNFLHNNTQWNHVLPIQINHLFEAEALFSIKSIN